MPTFKDLLKRAPARSSLSSHPSANSQNNPSGFFLVSWLLAMLLLLPVCLPPILAFQVST